MLSREWADLFQWNNDEKRNSSRSKIVSFALTNLISEELQNWQQHHLIINNNRLSEWDLTLRTKLNIKYRLFLFNCSLKMINSMNRSSRCIHTNIWWINSIWDKDLISDCTRKSWKEWNHWFTHRKVWTNEPWANLSRQIVYHIFAGDEFCNSIKTKVFVDFECFTDDRNSHYTYHVFIWFLKIRHRSHYFNQRFFGYFQQGKQTWCH